MKDMSESVKSSTQISALNAIQPEYVFNWCPSLEDMVSINSPELSPTFMIGFNTVGLLCADKNQLNGIQIITVYLHLTTYDLPVLAAKCSIGLINANQQFRQFSLFPSFVLNGYQCYTLKVLISKREITNNGFLNHNNQLSIYCKIQLFEDLHEVIKVCEYQTLKDIDYNLFY